jgi:hypothetical protein
MTHNVMIDDDSFAELPSMHIVADPPYAQGLQVMGFDPGIRNVDYAALELRVLDSIARSTQLPPEYLRVETRQPVLTRLDINVAIKTDLDANYIEDCIKLALGVSDPRPSLWDHLLED